MNPIEFARSFVGTHEGSAGHIKIINGYNEIRPLPRGYMVNLRDAWCAAFVSYVMKTCGYEDFPFECGCHEMWEKAEDRKMTSKKPKAGYAILYDWGADGSINHVGIVESIEGDTIWVIEGNNNDAVRRVPRNVNDIQIVGYIKVDISEKAEVVETPVQQKDSLDAVALEVIRGAYGNGEVRRVKLAAAGYDYKEVQARVNAIMNKNPANEVVVPKKSVDEIATEVIRGNFGNGAERRRRLAEAGYDYDTVQARVNEMLR